jgi:hypothetical protein
MWVLAILAAMTPDNLIKKKALVKLTLPETDLYPNSLN